MRLYQLSKEWWATLSVRDRQIAIIGGIILTIFLVYQFGWSVLMHQAADMRIKIVRDTQTLAAMQKADKAIQILTSKNIQQAGHASPVALLGVIQRQIDRNGLGASLNQLKQGGNDTIELHFQKVNFDKLMTLLIEVINDHHIAINQMSTSAEGEGLVNADIVLKN